MKTIKRIGNGWYDFSKIPQEERYIKIHALNCGTDRKALNRAKKLFGVSEYEIKD